MDALLALSLIAAKCRQHERSNAAAMRYRASGGADGAGGGWTTHADGHRERRITSMKDLSSFLGGGNLP